MKSKNSASAGPTSTTTTTTATTSADNASGAGGSFLWTWFLCGLSATCVNILYMGHMLARQSGSTAASLIAARYDPVSGELILSSGSSGSSIPDDNNNNNNKKHGDSVVDWDNLDADLRLRKGPLLELVREAGVTDVDLSTLEKLPDWSTVTNLYGEQPVILNYPEACHNFQALPDPAEHFVSTAGTFNTGTNLMAELLIANCHMPARMKKYGPAQRGVRWQVLWGKHTPVSNDTYRLHHRTYEDQFLKAYNIFPAVMTRDPYQWMQSMCRHTYGAHWRHDDRHCPQLVRDVGFVSKKLKNNPVTVEYAEMKVQHESLVGFYNDWYNDYRRAHFPHLMIRFEDLIFHPKEVVTTVCHCAGGELHSEAAERRGRSKPFQYIVESAKRGAAAHGSTRTSYLDALIRYGTPDTRYKGFTEEDLVYARKKLDPQLMQDLQYHYHDQA